MARMAFIGTGVMGRSMAGHLITAGHELTVFTRTPSKAEELMERGAVWAASPSEAVQGAEVVITMVGYPTDVEEVFLGPDGIVACAPPGALIIDMTTSEPGLALRIAEAAMARGLRPLDAPVSGGDIGARNAALTIMVGGTPEDFAVAEPVLRVLGPNVVRQGPAGSGQHAKMANQIAIAGTMLGVCEALGYAQAAGLDPATVIGSISAGAAGSWTMSNLAPRMLAEDFQPGFYVKHFIKDMRIAIDAATTMGLRLPGLLLAEQLYSQLAEQEGGAQLGTQALVKLYAPGGPMYSA